MENKIYIFDTTLRDGEQVPGCKLNTTEKLELALKLEALGVDIIEAGFPVSSPGDFESVSSIAKAIKNATVCGLSRAVQKDIEVAGEALRHAMRPRIHTGIGTSDYHIKSKFNSNREDILTRAVQCVKWARNYTDDVEFYAEDAGRTDNAYLARVIEAVIAAGATTVNIPDTTGYCLPHQYGEKIAYLVNNVPNIDKAVISCHCHNDLGLATANSIAGIIAGARQIECTINGLGERAGNTSLEEVVMVIKQHKDLGFYTSIEARELNPMSRQVSDIMRMPVQPNKAIVGANAFSHSSGIHQDGFLKDAQTYEIIAPEEVGADGSKIVLTARSGRSALAHRFQKLGYEYKRDDIDVLYAEFLKVADKHKEVKDEDLHVLAKEYITEAVQFNRMTKTLFDKIWNKHVVKQIENGPFVLYIDKHLIHEVTSPQAFTGLEKRGIPVFRPKQIVATADHNVPTLNQHLPIAEELSRKQVEALKDNCAKFGIELYGLGHPYQGIVHVIGPELGFTQPGMTIVCGDSHTSTHGAFGSIAFGIGTSEVEMVMATQCLLQSKPKQLRINVEGQLQPGVVSKDIVLYIISQLSASGGTGYFVEFAGSAIRNLSMEARMTICNMSIEMGARGGLIAPDETTFEYIKGREFAPKGEAWDKKLAEWKTLYSDSDAVFDKEITIDAAQIEPMITYGTNPGMGISVSSQIPNETQVNPADKTGLQKSLQYMGLQSGNAIKGQKIDYVFIGSCTNSRIEDLRMVASVVKGKKKADDVEVWIVPGSKQVEKQAKAEGIDKIFEEAGFMLRQPGCSACLGMNEDKIPAGKYCISTSNRNFEGRQGPNARTFLASPLTAAAAALTGVVTDVRELI